MSPRCSARMFTSVAAMKRGIIGTDHHVSPKHTERYAVEFAGRHNNRPMDTIDQMSDMVRRLNGKRLRYKDLTADNGQSREPLQV